MKQFLRHIFLLVALFVATANAWAECYVIEDKEITLKYQDRNSNGTGVSQTIDFSNGATLSFTYYIEKWAGGEHRLIVEGWDGTKWNELLNENIQYQTDPKTATNKDVTKYSKIRFTRTAYKGVSSFDAGKQTIKVTNIDITRIVSISASPTPLPDFAPTAVNSTSAPQEVTITYSNIGTTSNITSSNSTDFSISPTSTTFDACTGKATFNITFHPKGTTGGPRTGSFTIAGREAGSTTNKASITIKVSGTAKGLPTHTWTSATEYMVDQTINLSELWTSTSTGARTFRVVSFQETGINNEGGTTPSTSLITSTANGYTLKLSKAGTLKLAMDQVNNEVYSAHSSEITLTIKKHTPTFTWKTPVYFNTTITDYFSTNNKQTAIKIEGQTDPEVAYLYFNPNDENDKHTLDLTAYNKFDHSTKVTITQAENYYWKKHTVEHEVTPQYPNNHVTFTIDSEEKMTKIFKHSSNNEDDLTWDNGIRLGDDDIVAGFGGGDGGFDWSDKYIIIKFTGIPDSLFLTTDTDDAATIEIGSNVYFSISEGYIPQGTEDITFTKTWEYTKQNNDISLKLDPQTRCIKLCYTGNLRGWFKGNNKYSGVTVTELDEFYAVETTKETEKTEIEHLNFGSNQVTIDTTLYFDIKYANAGYKVKAVSNDNHFTVTPSETSSMGGDKYGLQTFAVTYTSNVPYATTDNNSYITITDELEHIKGHKDIVYLHASSDRAEQRLAWRDDFAAVDKPVVRISHDTIQHAAHSSSKLEITYTSSDPTVIEVIEEGTVLKLLKPGEATITAKQKGNNLFKPADQIEKTFIVTDKLLQFIIWTDAPTDIVKSGDNQTITLNALVHVQTDNGEIVYSEERTNRLKYTSGNPNIVSVTDNTLHVNATGKTTLTASVVGNEDYAEASLTVPVIVRSETAGCPDPLLYELEEPIQFFQGNTFEIVKDPIPLNTDVGIPGYVIIEHTGNEWRLPLIGTTFYEAAIRVEEKTASNSNWTTKGTIYPQKGQVMLDTIAISRDATEIRFVRNEGGQGYQFLNKIEVHPAQYIEAVDEIDFGTILVGSKETRTFDVNYSNIKDVLSPTPSSKDVVVTPKEFGACGTFGTQLITVDWTPSKVSPENGFTIETITFFDSNSDKEKVVTLKAFVQKGPQSIFWNDWDGEKPEIISLCNLMPFPEKTTADLPITWTLISGHEYANFIDGTNILELYQNGTITVQASSEASENYLAYSEEFTFVLEVTPIFLGTVDSSWENVENWNFKRLPCEAEVAFIQAPAILSSHATVQGITFVEGEQKVSLHITPTGGLTVNANGITNAAENGSSIVIDNTREGAGFLRISPDYQGTMPFFTMRYQTKSTLDNGANKDATWQYIGAPGNHTTIYVDYNTWLYRMNETTADGWELQDRVADVPLNAFDGYAITQYGQPTYEWTAQCTNQNYTLPLTYTKNGRQGRHIFANSYSAPIDVKAMKGLIQYNEGNESRFRIDETVYIFNSGSWSDWNTHPQTGDDTPGQYYAIPIAAAAANYLSEEQTVIPPMQGFYMRVRSKTPLDQLVETEQVGQIVLDYNTLVMGNNHSMNTAMRAPQHPIPNPYDNLLRIRIQATSANSGTDRVYVIQDEINTNKYNNGYDAPNQETKGLVNIYTNESFGKMEVSCSNNIDSLYIGFMAGEDSLYTLHFGAQRGQIYLKDLHNDSIIHMRNNQQYHFTATPLSTNNTRFQILLLPDTWLDFPTEERNELVSDIHNTIDTPVSPQVWSDGYSIYISNAPIHSTATLFNIGGQPLFSTTLHDMPYTIDISHLTAGVYVLRLNNQAYKFICQ